MKHFIYSLLVLAAMAFTFSSCEDVPMPYGWPNNTPETPSEDLQPTGDGTLENPYNSVAANELAKSLESGAESGEVYIKGKVVAISEQFGKQFGNATFYISDDGTANGQFYVFRTLYLGNKKYSEGDLLEIGDEVIVCGSITNYMDNTPETVQGKSYVYSINGKTAEGEGTVGEPAGDGTKANPYNVAAALKVVSALTADTPTEPLYVKGIISRISQIDTGTYGNANYYISDDGSTSGEIYIFQSFYLGNEKFTSDSQIKVGDEVIIYGPFTNFKGNTPETVGKGSSCIYSLNGKTANGGDAETGGATGDGSKDKPFNSVAANNYVSSLDAGAESENEIYVKGKIVSIKENYTTQFGNATFYISDDGTAENQFYVFRALYLNNAKYTEGNLLAVGDEVVVCGKVVNYMGNTPETVQGKAYLYSWKKGEGGTGGETGDPTATNGNFESWTNGQPTNWKTTSTAGNATLSQSTDAHGGSYSVKVGGTTTANKRIGYKETELKAGDYTLTFYAKAATATGASVRPGYVPVTDGKVGSYTYGDYTNNLSNTAWTLVTHTFSIAADGTYCIVIMNAKSPGADVLIDDVVLKKGSTVIID